MNNTLVEVAVDTIKNPHRLEHFSKETGVDTETRLLQEVRNLIDFNPTNLQGRALNTAFDKAIRKNQAELFAFLEEVLDRTFLKGIDENEFFMQFAEVRNLSLGDSVRFYLEDDGIVTVSEVSNGNWDIRRQKFEGGESFTVETKTYGAAMYDDFFAFAMGRITFPVFVRKVAEGFQKHLNSLVAGAFGKAVEELPDELSTEGAFDLTKLQEIVGRVEAMAGSAVVIGTRAGLSRITQGADAHLLTPEQIMQRQKNGGVSYFEGMTLVQLPQVLRDNTFDFAYDDKELLIVPASETSRPIKVVVEGSGMVREATVPQINQDQTHEYTYTTSYGVNVVIDSAFGHYKITQ